MSARVRRWRLTAPLNEAGARQPDGPRLRRALAQGTPPRPAGNLVVQLPDDRFRPTAHLADVIGLDDALAAAHLREPPAAPESIVEDVMKMTEAEMAAVIAREFASSITGHAVRRPAPCGGRPAGRLRR